MSREEYLSALYAHLHQRLPSGELEHIMKYYEDYFDEAGPEREEEVIVELGSPENLANQVVDGGRRSAHSSHDQGERRDWTAGRIIALVCLSPLWLTLLVLVVAVPVGLVLGFAAGGLGVVAGGVFTMWCGFTALFTPGLTTAMFFAGLGIFFVAFGLTMLAGALALSRVCGKGAAALCRWLFIGGRRREAV